MIVKSVTVGGFKNIKKTRIDLNKIVVLASLNNYGKSNLLEAISFGFDFIAASNKLRRAMMSWPKGIPLTPDLAYENYMLEVEIDEPGLGQYRYIRYGFSFSWLNHDDTGQKITDEWLETRKSESVRYSSFIKRTEGRYRKGYSTQAYRKVILDNAQLAIDVLSSVDTIEISDVIRAVQKMKFQVCSSLDLQDRFIPPPFEFVDGYEDSKIDLDDDDIPRALFLMRRDFPEKYLLFKEAVFNLFPEFTDILIQVYELKSEEIERVRVFVATSGSNEQRAADANEFPVPLKIREELYRLSVKSAYLNQPINASLMSAGTKRIIWILANIFTSSCGGVSFLGIEELETSIHPKLLKKLLEILTDIDESISVIVSSHSPYIIQYLKPTQIYLGLSDKGNASFKRISASKSKALGIASQNLGVSTGEYLFELMAGNADSTSILSQYLEDLNNDGL